MRVIPVTIDASLYSMIGIGTRFMNYRNELTLYWLIKQHSPVSIDQLISRLIIANNMNIPSNLIKLRDQLPENPLQMRVKIEAMLDILIENNLIEIVSSDEDIATTSMLRYPSNIKLQSKKPTEKVLRLLSIDIQQYLNFDGPTQLVQPIFGSPPSRYAATTDIFAFAPNHRMNMYLDQLLDIADDLDLICRHVPDIEKLDTFGMQYIWASLLNCRICIADLSNSHANVLYLLGVAHTIGCRTILLADTEEDVPSHLLNSTFLTYEISDDGLEKLHDDLWKLVSNMKNNL